MTETLAPRSRKVKILATLGPATSSAAMIRKLMLAGADAFRINMSHGDQKTKAKLVEHIRALEKEFHRPTTILFDLQGPKLRVGQFEGGRTVLEKGQRFIFDRDDKAGDECRVQLPHGGSNSDQGGKNSDELGLFSFIRANLWGVSSKFHWRLWHCNFRPRTSSNIHFLPLLTTSYC